METFEIQENIKFESIYFPAAAWDINGKRFAITNGAKTIYLCDDSGKVQDKFSIKAEQAEKHAADVKVVSLCFSSDDSKLAVGQSDLYIKIYRIGSEWGFKKSLSGKLPMEATPLFLFWGKNLPLLVAQVDGTLKTCGDKKYKAKVLLSSAAPCTFLDARIDGAIIFSAHIDGSVNSFAVVNQDIKFKSTIGQLKSPIISCAWMDSNFILCTENRNFYCIDENGKILAKASLPTARTFCPFLTSYLCGNTVVLFLNQTVYELRLDHSCIKMDKISDIPQGFLVVSATSCSQSPFIILGRGNGPPVLAYPIKRRLLWKNEYFVTFCTKNFVYISTLAKPSEVKLVLRSRLDASGIIEVKFQNDSKHVLAVSRSSLVFGSIEKGTSWEILFRGSRIGLKFCVRDTYTLIHCGNELSVIDKKSQSVLPAIITTSRNLGLVSVCTTEKGIIIAYPSWPLAISIFDFQSHREIATLKMLEKPVSASISPEGNHLLVKDTSKKLWFYDIKQNTGHILEENVSFYQWFGAVLFAQVGEELKVHSDPMCHNVLRSFTIAGEAKRIIDENNKVKAIFISGGVEKSIELDIDNSLRTALHAKLKIGNISSLVDTLTKLSSSELFKFDKKDTNRGTGGFDNIRTWENLEFLGDGYEDNATPFAKARKALMKNDVESAASILDQAGEKEKAFKLLREMKRWDLAIEYAQSEDLDLILKLRAEWIEWLTSSGLYKEAGKLLEEQGSYIKALDMYIRCGALGSAAKLVGENGPFRNDIHAQEKVLDQLKNCGLWKEAGKIFESRRLYPAAIDMYIKGNDFEKAVLIAKEHAPNEVVSIEDAWGEYCFLMFDFDEALVHFLEAGKIARAFEVAIKEKMWEQALDIYQSVQSQSLLKIGAVKLAKYCESVNKYEVGASILESAELFKEAIEMSARHGLWRKAVDVSLRAPDGEVILDIVCQLFLNSNQLEKAEALYLAMGRHDLAVQMYQNKNFHDKALNILTQAGHLAINEKQGIVEDLISKGRGKEAQDMLARTGDITGYISLSKKLGLWEDALNMSEKLGADELFSVVHDWYNDVGPEKPARALLRNNKLHECIDTGIKKGEGKIVLSLGKAGGIMNLDGIIDQAVEQNVQNGNINEAVTLLKESGKYAEIVQLYIKNELWKEANAFAKESGDMNTINQVQEAELDAAKRQRDLPKLEELALRLGRVQIAVDAFTEAGLHANADRLRNEYGLPVPSNNAKDVQSDYLTSFPRSFNLNAVPSPSSSSAIDNFLENNDWSSALELALSMNSDVLPDLLRKWLSSLGDVKSLSLNEVLPLMSRYGGYLPTESLELLLASGKELCGQPWSLDYKIWAEIRDCFWNAAELWGLSDKFRPVVERYFWATHLMAVKCASASQPKSESLAAKALIGLLRYADLMPADWLFLEAGKYAQRQEWLTAAFILYNAGLDLCEVIEEGSASDGIDPVDWEEWAELGVPIDQLRLEELKCEESKIEKARDWVLSISLDPKAAKDVSIGAYDGLSEFLGGRMASGCVLTGCTLKPPIVKFECQLAASRLDFDLLRSGDNWPDFEIFLQKWLGRPVE